MRTRTKYDDTVYGDTLRQSRSATRANVNSPWSAFTNWSNSGSATKNVLLNDGESVITDDITPAAGVKTVTHTRRSFAFYNSQFTDEYTNTNRYQNIGNGGHSASWGQYGKLQLSNIVASYPKTINQLKAEAMHKFHKQNEVDTLLNLVESPQLITSAQSIIRLMKAHAKRTRSGRRNNSLPSLASSGFLAWSFGLAPLISDIQKINRAIPNIKRDIDRYIRDANRKYVVSCTSTGVLTPSITAAGYSSNPNNNDTSVWHVGIYPTTMPLRRVGVKGRRAVEYNSASLGKLDYVIRRFIATGPASLAWERIPFSFVVDWFVNLSGVIDALDNALTGNSRHIDTVWMSEKWATLVPVYKHKYVGWTSNLDGTQTAQNVLSYYHREAISPDPTIALSGRFGKKQVALTAALLHQIVANLRVWR